MDVHEHCHRVFNYDPERNVVFCSKCKTEWHEPVPDVLVMPAVETRDVRVTVVPEPMPAATMA